MRSRRFARLALRVLAVGVALAALDWTLGRWLLADDLFLGNPIAPFDPPLFSASQRGALARIERELGSNESRATKLDAELGWCNKPDSGFGEFRYDWAGSRIGQEPLARAKPAGVRRVVAVGCSMTHGDEVGATESWCARLDATRADLELANLGVAAYGIDQALLRLRRAGWALAPDEVWLGILPQAGLRVTTLFRPLLDHWSLDVAFKPRFRLDAAGELELVANPARSAADVVRLLNDQRAFLDVFAPSDPWVARAPRAYAPRGTSWLERSFAARLALTVHEKRGRDVRACFDEGQEFGVLYTAIVRAMARDCSERGVVFRIVVLPGRDDLRARVRDGQGYWDAWLERRRAEGLRGHDLADALAGPDAEGRALFAPNGHYSPTASALVAEALSGALDD
jgi:hypothetical protein